jgi:hypothetical protein
MWMDAEVAEWVTPADVTSAALNHVWASLPGYAPDKVQLLAGMKPHT